jgi:hypothetical protein
MRIYEVTISGRYQSEGESEDYSFTFYFKHLPTRSQVLAELRRFCSEGTQWEATHKLASYIPYIERHSDLEFVDNGGTGRAIYPTLSAHEWQIPPSAPETCYLYFTYHEVVENAKPYQKILPALKVKLRHLFG